ncbi:hypothetical protein HO173_004248 [Letharia columbiana]|uniref:RING-type domain-containing protein n=1 Tax=Letharia columbiana TaxID=112416 RepID=A0A8H6FYU8_9LECA|nr:uncharacterized protein HO173_004248 [Letharia columbiana]KAF6237358.1 hypothetical protein HO173_004248 [Letharia columbiana]
MLMAPQWQRRREHNTFLKGVQHELLIHNTFSAWGVSFTSLFQVSYPLPSSFFHFNMAKEFLNQLLRLENSIKFDSGQRCMICLEECGSLSSHTGIIECLMRLPCNHLVGSHCVATWLHDHNTCPVCKVYFSQRGRDPTSSMESRKAMVLMMLAMTIPTTTAKKKTTTTTTTTKPALIGWQETQDGPPTDSASTTQHADSHT